MDKRRLFGTIAREKGYITREELNAALLDQARRKENGEDRRLGSLLVEKGTMDPAGVIDVLEAQGKNLLRCLACRTPYTVPASDAASLTCPRCGGHLDPPPEGDLGEDSLPLREEEGTLYVIEDEPTYAGSFTRSPGDRDDAPPPPPRLKKDTGTETYGTAGPPMAPPPEKPAPGPGPDLATGDIVGGCEIIRLLGRGGMGSVYEAKHVALNKRVALKILSPHLVGHPVLIQRFLQEARTAARLDHAGVVPVLNVGEEGGVHFIVMQYVEGESLGKLLDRTGKLPLRRALGIARQVALGLEAAHGLGIIHRDVKPSNIMIQPDGTAKIADFGLAKEVDAEATLSRAGQVLGSPHYLSPEQADAGDVDHRTDIYSLGVTLFHSLSGRRPFTARSPVGVIMKHINDPPPDLRASCPDLPPACADIVLKMMAKNPDDRYPSCKEVVAAIDAVLRPPALEPAHAAPAGRWLPWLAAGAALALLVAGALAGAMGLGWIGVPFEAPAPAPAPEENDGRKDYEAALAFRTAHPSRRAEALERFRAVLAVWGPDTPYGKKARGQIEAITRQKEQEAAERLASARKEAEAALARNEFEQALAAVEGLPEALAQTPSAYPAVLLERSVRRRVQLGRLQREAEALAEEHRFDEILDRLAAWKARLPEEDRALVEEAEREWRRKRDRREEKAAKALEDLLETLGPRPEDLQDAVDRLRTFTQTWRGTRACARADEARLAFEESLLSSGDAKKDLEALEAFLEANPDDLDTAIARFRALAARHPGTPAGDKAGSKARTLSALREQKALEAFEAIRERASGLPPEKAVEIYDGFPEGLDESDVYGNQVKPEKERLAAAAETRDRGAREALREAEALLAKAPSPAPAETFRAILEAFRAVAAAYPGTPQAEAGAARAERLETDRRVASYKAYREASEKARELGAEGDWKGAQEALEEGFLTIYEDSPFYEKGLQDLDRIKAGRLAAQYRGRLEEALAQIEAYEKEHPEDFRGALSRYEELLGEVDDAALRSAVQERIEGVKTRLERAARLRFEAALAKAADAEKAGRRGEAIEILRAFPEDFRGTASFEEAASEARKREAVAEEAIRGAEEILQRDPYAFETAWDELHRVLTLYAGTVWARRAERKIEEIKARAAWAARRKLREADGLYEKDRVEEAKRLYEEVAGWEVDQVSAQAVTKARRCAVRLARRRLLELVGAGRHLEAVEEAERLLGDPAYADLADSIRPLRDHARNLRDGFVRIPGGAFEIRGEVEILKPYYILRTEVTNAQYKLFLLSGDYDEEGLWDADAETRRGFVDRTGAPGPRHWRDGTFPEGTAGHPVRYVSWHEARAYARWRGGDLPTEAQWEVAAGWDPASASLRPWPWGRAFSQENAWTGRGPEGAATRAVGTFPAGVSAYGLLDAAGNVSEWVLDWADPARKRYRVLKGGDSSDFAVEERTRITSRERASPSSSHPLAGFRIARPGADGVQCR